MLSFGNKYVNKQYQHFACQRETLFVTQLTWFFDEDFKSSWSPLTSSFLKGPLEREFWDIYMTMFSESVISEIQNLWGSSFFSKCSTFKLDFESAAKTGEKRFSSWDNCISIGIVKLSLLRTGSFSLAANVLPSYPQIFHVNQRDFFQLSWLCNDHSIW